MRRLIKALPVRAASFQLHAKLGNAVAYAVLRAVWILRSPYTKFRIWLVAAL